MKHKFLLLTATLCTLLLGVTQLRAEEVPFAFANKNDLLGWTASPAPGGFESASPSRGLSWSKQAMTMTYTLSGYGISHVKVVASSNNANNYVLSVNSGTGQSVPKENNKDFDFDVDVADGGTVTISTTYDGNGKSFYIKSITFTKASGGGDTKPSVPSEQFSWNEAAATVTMGAGDNTYPSLTNSIPVSVTYSSSNTAVATINETSGVIELVKAGSTNISAIFTGNDTYAATTVTYALTVNPAPLTPIAGGVIDELTISDLGVTGGYTAFTDKQASNTDHSDAVYAGTVAKNSDNIQLNSGQTTSKLREIVTTTSGGKAKRVQAIWGGSNTASRKLTVYGSNEAYTGSENAASGTAIGDLVYTAGDTYAYLDIDDDYEYLQIVASGAIYMSQINITWLPGAPAAVAAPTFTPAAGTFDAAQSVTLDCETSGASIYYTLDGTTPTSSSTLYNGAITVSETKTIKAIAIKGSDNSSVATATYTINLPLATMDAIFAAATTAGSTATDVTINFQNWVVSGAKGSTAYVTDGTKGFIIYYSGHGFTAGDILSGSASFKLKLYNGAAEVTAKNSGEVTITKGGTATLNTLDATGISELSGINTGSLIKINGYASQESSKYYVAGVQLYTTLSSEFTYPTAGNEYNCTGVYVQYNSTKEIMPRSAADVEEITEEGAPEAPTFSPAAGTYTAVQSVELSCATDGAAIYYTTDGSVPTASSTPYSSAISVGEDMTIKAIAIKNDKSSSLATAAYTINLPENPETSKTWDLSIDETASASADELTWTATYVDMSYAKAEASSNANNYYPGTSGQSYTSTRFYKNGVITITPNNKQITTIVFTATTSGYATTLANSTWTNATAAASGTTVTVTASGIGAVSATIGNTCGFTAVKVNYTAIDPSIPVAPTFTPAAGTYTSVQSVELSCATDGAAIYYTIDGSTPTSASTLYSGAISVEADMTIKAIAIKDAKSGPVATAAYVINLPVDESTTKTWDLSINETASASADELTWTATYVGMSYAKAEASSPANNYYPGTSGQSYTSTRFYKDGVLTITPTGKQITTIVFTATSESYATALKNSTWTNATAAVSSTTVTVTASGIEAVSATISGTCGITAVTVNYTDIDPSIPVAPTFTPAAGTYTSVQSVELSCATDGAAIYYTIDGSTPTSASTLYSGAISVEADMTIKAIAIKDAKSGPVATAAYVINLPVDESTTKTWDLSINETASASADELTWTATYVGMSYAKAEASSPANNYYPGTSGQSYTSTRFYKNGVLTITPNTKQITTIVFTATTAGYATTLGESSWENATADVNDKTVTVTASGAGAVSVTIGNTCGFTAVTVNYITLDPSIPVAPTFTPAAGTYSSVQSVTLACETTGAAIYYTTDGSTPTSESTLYSSAISVGVNMTIKAIAIKDAKSGPVATANYVINLPLTSMDAIFTKATDVKTTATDVNVTFGSWVISGVSTNGKQAYLTDGTKGLIIFDNSAAMGFNVGDVLTGTAACKVQLYNGASELTTLSSTTEGLSVATGGSVTPVVKAISDLSGINTGAPVTINNVWFDGTNLTDGTNSIQPYNTLFAYEEFTENKYYNVTGIYLQFGSKKEILPRKAADIEELSISAPSMIWYTSNAKAVEIAANATHSIGLYEAFAPVFETNSEGAKTYSSTNESVASIDAATGELTVNGVGDTEIRCAVTANGDYAAGSQAFTLHVAENAAEENVVIVAKFGNQWLAMKHDLTAVEVYFAGGKIVNADAETQAAITWKRTVDEENVTFQTSDNKYLKTGSSTTLSVEANASGSYIWTWNSTYYRTGESTRTFLYQGNAAKFKNYTASNAGKASDGGYSELPIVTRAVFTTDAHVRDLTTMTGNYGTICLPYQVNAGDYTGASFYEVAYRDGMETVFVDEVKTLEAGKPYIFVRQQDLLVAVYSGSPVADPISVNGAYGTFSRIEFNNGELTAEDYILSRDMLWKCYADYGLNAYRAYFKVAEITTDVPAPKFGKRRLAIGTPNNTPTELENINNSEIQAVRKIMIDGHLYIVRDGKFFDATGRLVK